ncbi:hypothetical protein HZA98_05040 [Candidatus Woesearchaeota archaeon]|nr:hypothetical protein [Candidatus Woesearchaeota archaeon]
MRGIAKSILLLPFFYNTAKASEWSLSVAYAERGISEAEPSVNQYLKDRGYIKQIPSLEDSINLEGYRMPYLGIELSKTDQIIEHHLAVNWTSSIFGAYKDQLKIPFMIRAFDIGNVDVKWEFTLNHYESLAYGIQSTMCSTHGEYSRLRLDLMGELGLSYFDADVAIHVNLKDNTTYKILGRDLVAEQFGIAENTTISGHAYGPGLFGAIALRPALQIDYIEIQLSFGYRLEGLSLTVDETVKSVKTTKTKAEGTLNASGTFSGIALKYYFH